MKTKKRRYFSVVLVVGCTALANQRVEAHCDTIDGPVVVDAQAALAKADVSGVLKWIKAEHEEEIRTAFEKTLAVRANGSDARELADMYFFETLVRIHRAGEGAPYTGLKPAGTDPGPAVTAADRALKQGNVDELAKRIAEHAEAGVRKRFASAIEMKQHADHNTEAGRAFVDAYVAFVHYVEGLHNTIQGDGDHHTEGEVDGQPKTKSSGGCGYYD
jgi:hypothetical protein